MLASIADRKDVNTSQSISGNNYLDSQNTTIPMVWIKWSDYGKPKKKKTQTKSKKKKSQPRIEPKIKIIPGKHKVEFKKASEL